VPRVAIKILCSTIHRFILIQITVLNVTNDLILSFLLSAALMTLSEFLRWTTLMTHVFWTITTGQADGCPHSSMASSCHLSQRSLVNIMSLYFW
jgi:hypothetical protein